MVKQIYCIYFDVDDHFFQMAFKISNNYNVK